MTAKPFRVLFALCCAATAILVTYGSARYVMQKRWVAALNTPENVASGEIVEFRAPVATSNSFYIGGLFLALGACFWIKATQESAALAESSETDESSISDE